MNTPPTQERRPGETGAASTSFGGDSDSLRQTCAECGREPVAPGFKFFGAACIAEYVTALDRRRAAELRLPVLGVVA